MAKNRIKTADNDSTVDSTETKGDQGLRHSDEGVKSIGFNQEPFTFSVRLIGPGITKGKIELGDLIIVAKAVQDSLERYAVRSMVGGVSLRPGRRKKMAKQNVRLYLRRIGEGSVELDFNLAYAQRDLLGNQFGNGIVDQWTESIGNLHDLPAAIPAGFDRGVLIGINDLKTLFSKGVDEVQFSWRSKDTTKIARFDLETSKKVDTLLLRPATNRRTVSGHILEADFSSTTLSFTLYTDDAKVIHCTAFEEDWGIVHDSMMQHVRVTGEAQVDTESGEVRSVRADNIEVGGGIELTEDLPLKEIRDFWSGRSLKEMISSQDIKPVPKDEIPDWTPPNEEEWAAYERMMKKHQSQRIE